MKMAGVLKEYKYNTPDEWLQDYAMGGKYDPKEVSPEVTAFAKQHNFDIPSMIKALKDEAKEEPGWDPADEDEWLAEELKTMNEQGSGGKVYVLAHEGDFDPYDIYGIYSSLENAKRGIVENYNEVEAGKIGSGERWEIWESPLDSYLRRKTVFEFNGDEDEPFWK